MTNTQKRLNNGATDGIELVIVGVVCSFYVFIDSFHSQKHANEVIWEFLCKCVNRSMTDCLCNMALCSIGNLSRVEPCLCAVTAGMDSSRTTAILSAERSGFPGRLGGRN